MRSPVCGRGPLTRHHVCWDLILIELILCVKRDFDRLTITAVSSLAVEIAREDVPSDKYS